jgi:cysteinyl-tRNA synthetase
MPLRLYNTLTKQTEQFAPIAPPRVTMYHCGPTVYSYAHVGNFRSFLLGDLLRRVIAQRGYEVTQVMNITDVGHLTEDELDRGEDKLTKTAIAERRTPEQVAEFYTAAFFEDLDALGILRAHHYPRASRHVEQMIEHIRRLEEKGYAYLSGDTVLFDVARFPRYGALSGRRIEDLRAGFGGRVTEEELAGKRSPQDFRLWKVDPGHLMCWDSPWGKGYPGWHIECSTMAMQYLGETIDIHTGGEDNVFPHHESEIAQAEALSEVDGTEEGRGKPFAKMWVHTQHLMINGQKMSKRLGNTYRVGRYTTELGVHPLALRLAILSMHHGKQGNLSDEAVGAAQETVDRLVNFGRRMRGQTGEGGREEAVARVAQFRTAFDEALDDDLNVSAAMAALQTFVTDINRLEPGAAGAQEALGALDHADAALKLLRSDAPAAAVDAAEIDRLVAARVQARKERRFAEADAIREDLRRRGILLEDSPQGTTWRVVEPR